MKKYIGLVILIIVLVAVSGCTQQAKTTPVTTTVPTEVPTTVATTTEATIAPTAEATVEATPVTTTVAGDITAAPETTGVPVTTQIITAGMTPSTAVTVIHIVNGTFNPSVIMLLPGSGISWVNDDRTVHSVKMIGEHQGMFNSGDIVPTAQWHYAFGKNEGTYEYADGYNPEVKGTIIIKSGKIIYGMVTPTTYMTSNATW